jgi:hypothetical protein
MKFIISFQCFFVQEDSGNNVLRRVYLDEQEDKVNQPETTPEVATLDFSLMALGKVQMTAEIDVFTPQFGPILTASQISKPVSRNTLSILKQSLPL